MVRSVTSKVKWAAPLLLRTRVVGLLLAGWIGLMALGLTGCASRPANVLEEPIVGSGVIGDLVASGRPTAVLIYPAGYCFSCSPELARWQRLDRDGHVEVVILLTEKPSGSDRCALALRRIRVSGVLLDSEQGVPREYLVEKGRVQVAAVGVEETGGNSAVLMDVMNRQRRLSPG